MLIQYAYIKQRSQFGKQCFFEESMPIAENILPDPELMRDYIHRSHCHRGTQKSQQFALHEMQTTRKITKDSGMLHSEGGWPKEINAKDEEAVIRFRRRVEKDENWASRMKKLTDPMEHRVRQNNAINIYENYFENMVPSTLILPRDIRTTNVYTDPQPIVRPVRHLSWSPGASNRLAASYSFTEFEVQPSDVNLCSYIWDIDNPNIPVVYLRSSSPLMTIEFNPRDLSMLISGLMSGQVCNWDIRIGDRPVQISHRQFSHRNPANQALWIASKTNTEFFSSSTDGTIKWWDIRKLREPIDVLVMDLDDPLRAEVVRAIGATTLQFEHTMGSRFMVGTENGMVINANRKAATPLEKLATRFKCHVGPVIAIDRNPFILKNFLTVGDCTVKIWADDTREGSLIGIREQNVDLSGGCWSRSRYSVFFTINVTGLLEVYDILAGVDSPVTVFRVCNDCLTTIAPHEGGQILAVGSQEGNIYLVECSEGHTVNARTDKLNLIAYLESCSRFEKTVDARLKEIRLMQASIREDPVMERPAFVSKGTEKKGNSKEKNKDKAQSKGKHEQQKKKSRSKKAGKDDAFFMNDVELAKSEAEYFGAVEKAFATYPSLEELNAEQMMSLAQEMSPKKKKRELSKIEEEPAVQKQRRPVEKETVDSRELKSPVRSLPELEVGKEEEATVEVERRFMESKKAIGKCHGKTILRKVCDVEVCKPEICCADMEEKRKPGLKLQSTSKGKESSRDITSISQPRESSGLVQKLPEHSASWQRESMLEDESLADVLADEVEKAKREVRAWQKKVTGKRDYWRPQMIEDVHAESSEKKKEIEKCDNGSPVEERKPNFRQCVSVYPGKKSKKEDQKETFEVRSVKDAEEFDFHPEKCSNVEEMHPKLSTCVCMHSDESIKTTRMSPQHENQD